MVKFAVLMEGALVLGTLLFVTFQIIVPILKHTPLFPLFRKERAEAMDALAEAREKAEINAIETEATEIATGLSGGKNRKGSKQGVA